VPQPTKLPRAPLSNDDITTYATIQWWCVLRGILNTQYRGFNLRGVRYVITNTLRRNITSACTCDIPSRFCGRHSNNTGWTRCA
jgi:hypothetical protein